MVQRNSSNQKLKRDSQSKYDVIRGIFFSLLLRDMELDSWTVATMQDQKTIIESAVSQRVLNYSVSSYSQLVPGRLTDMKCYGNIGMTMSVYFH